MGRGQKRTGRTSPQALDRRLAGLEMRAALALVTAAGASPGVRHRWPSVGYMLQRVLTAPPSGRSSVSAVKAGGLLDACRREQRGLAAVEDFVPVDPREVVLVRLGDETLRLAPGQVERPVADVTRWKMVAQATDSVLVPQLKFGVSDYVEVGLRYSDLATQTLAPSWPSGDLAMDGPAVLTDEELIAAQTLLKTPVDAAIASSEALRAALDWATAQQGQLPYDPTSPQSTFGRYLAASLPGLNEGAISRFWLPLGFLPESLGQGVNELARQAAMTDPAVSMRFAQLAAENSRRALWRFSDTIVGTPDTGSGAAVSPGDVAQWVVMFGPARALLVQMLSRPYLADSPFLEKPAVLRVAEEARSNPEQVVRVPLPGGSLTLAPQTEVVPLLLVASAGHLVAPQRPGLASMSLEDLQWASATAESDTDLYTFCRELASPDRPPIAVWETFDLWEWWRANGKTFFAGGRPPDLMMVSPHHSSAEWERNGHLQHLEQALAQLGFPGIDAWDALDPPKAGPYGVYQWRSEFPDKQCEGAIETPQSARATDQQPTVPSSHHDRPDLYGWRIHANNPPVAVRCAHPSWGDDYHQLLHDLAGSYTFGFDEVRDAWQVAHFGTSTTGYIVELRAASPEERTTAGSIHVEAAGRHITPRGQVIHAQFLVDCERLAEETHEDVLATRDVMAQTIRSLLEIELPPAAVDTVVAAWQAAPPTLAIRIMRAPVSRPHLARPWKLDPSLIAKVDQEVARAVQAANVAPGTYTGASAKELDRDVLAPAALEALTRRLAQHDTDDLVTTGMRQIERTLATKNQQLRDLEQTASLLKVTWDPVEHQAEIEHEYLLLRRCNEMAIEAALRSQPTGNRLVDQYAWMEITAAASAYLAATSRSEAVHHQVRPTGLGISEAYEITTVTDLPHAAVDSESAATRVFDLDLDAFRRARAAHALSIPTVSPVSEEGSEPPGELALQPGAERIVAPNVDSAILAAYGASVSDLLEVLFSLAHWPLGPTDPDAVAVSADAVRQHLLDTLLLADETDGHARIDAALKMLTSTSSALMAADWKPWHARSRQKRLIVQPLGELRSGQLVVGPHLCYATAGVYLNFVTQGILPWTQPAPPRPVEVALEAVRDAKNMALETEVAQTLRDAGYAVQTHIQEQDPQRLGVPSLQTEIDVVAGRDSDPVIWLIEVKDPADVHAVPEIRRHLDKFYVDHRKPSYATQLQRKLDDLAPHAADVAAALGLPTTAEPRVVKALFVTRSPVAAGYVSGPFDFYALPDLLPSINTTTK